MAARKKTTKKKAAKKGGSKPSYDFCIAALQKNKNASFAEIRDAAAKKGMILYPIVYGRAKAALGLVPVAKRGESKKRKAAKKTTARGGATRRKTTKRGRGRPRSTPAGFDDFLAEIKQTQRERDNLVALLGKIRDTIDAAI